MPGKLLSIELSAINLLGIKLPDIKLPSINFIAFIVFIVLLFLPSANALGEVTQKVFTLVSHNSRTFVTEADELNKKANKYQKSQLTAVDLRKQLLKTRLAYKRLEFLYTYYYPEHVEAYINGVPLPHLDPYPFQELPLPEAYYNEPTFIQLAPLDYQEDNAYIKPRLVVDPVGLQVLDELIFSDDLKNKKERLIELSDSLAKRARILSQAITKRQYIEPYQLIEAARLELIRIFTQGVTGYDTPASGNGLADAKTALLSMQTFITLCIRTLPEKQQDEINILFNRADKYLNQYQDINEFNHVTFLKSFINPLYEKLLAAHHRLQLKSTGEITGETTSWNFFSNNIFSSDFLNPYYYGLLPKQQDSDSLRELGKRIFNDKNISENHTISCASCHFAEKAFSDGEPKSNPKKLDTDKYGAVAMRNAPGLINAIFSDKFFYDMRVNNPDEQFKHVVLNPMEFNTSFDSIAQKLNQDNKYKIDFADAFKSTGQPISRRQISAALTSYIISLRSFDSPFDQFIRDERKTINPEVIAGFNIFMGKAQCGTCHFPPTFSGLVPPLYQENDSEVLGVFDAPNSKKIDKDMGRFANQVFQENIDIYAKAFKTPGIRNITLTAPYFHNGAYKTLDDVLEFYDKGGAQGLGLEYEVPNQTLLSEQLNLTEVEKFALKAFMESLTDSTLTEKFGEIK